MKRFSLIFFVLCLGGALTCLSQNPYGKIYKKKHKTHKHNISFAGGLFAGLILTDFFDNRINQREMYFAYNYNKDNWRLKKDFNTNSGYGHYRSKIIARFENPNGGRDFFVKINRRGEWWIDAPKRLKKLLKNKVKKNL